MQSIKIHMPHILRNVFIGSFNSGLVLASPYWLGSHWKPPPVWVSPVTGTCCDWESHLDSWSIDVDWGDCFVMHLHCLVRSLVLVVWLETWLGWMNGVVPEWQLSSIPFPLHCHFDAAVWLHMKMHNYMDKEGMNSSQIA